MKILATTLAALAALAGPAAAGSITERVTGCATVDKGGYLNFADPACMYRAATGEDREQAEREQRLKEEQEAAQEADATPDQPAAETPPA